MVLMRSLCQDHRRLQTQQLEYPPHHADKVVSTENTPPATTPTTLTPFSDPRETTINQPTTSNPPPTKPNLHCGDHFDTQDPATPEYIRLYSQNVNGLIKWSETREYSASTVFEAMANNRIDIFAFQETHLCSHHPTTHSTLKEARRKVWDGCTSHCAMTYSSTATKEKSYNKPGGVLLAVTGSLIGRIKAHIKDPLGRWTGFELLGKAGRTLVVLSLYQVVKTTGPQGPHTFHSQQIAQLRLAG